MSGHSHFKTVKATKDANDAKKGKIFSKLARVITMAVKEKGPDTITNAQLKTAIEKAKEFNMPKENIERAIKKGTGELAGEELEKEKGPDTITNAQLKTAIEKAKEFNMPKENIERAIKKGTGELAGEELEEVSFEGLGPGGVAIIMEGITDNKNRTLGEVKGILSQHGGKMAGEGAVRWMFERKGVIVAEKKDLPAQAGDLESLAIEAGADDIRENAI